MCWSQHLQGLLAEPVQRQRWQLGRLPSQSDHQILDVVTSCVILPLAIWLADELVTMPTLEDNNRRLTQEFFEALSRGDVAAIVDAYDDEGSCWTSGRTLISGTLSKEQIRAGAGAVLETFPEGLAFTIHAMTAEGERVAVEAESRGRHASGAIYNNHYHFLLEFRRGKLLRLKEYMDTELVTDILCNGQRPLAESDSR